MAMVYETIQAFIGSKEGAAAKIVAIEALIEAMLLKLAESAGGQAAVFDEYSIDDGQMKVRTSYRSVTDVTSGIISLRKLKNYYINDHNGHVSVLRDVRGFR